MVRSVVTAAWGQARVLAAGERDRQRPQPEEEDQENGKPAPHLGSMLHEKRQPVRIAENGRALVGYYRTIAFSQLTTRGKARV
jgi:hypothetical protein